MNGITAVATGKTIRPATVFMGDNTKNSTHAPRWTAIGALFLVILSGCGSGASGDPISALPANANQLIPADGALLDEPLLEPTLPEIAQSQPGSTAPVVTTIDGAGDAIVAAVDSQSDLPFDDAANLDQVSEIITLADTGLRVGFTHGLHPDDVNVNLVEASWANMQSCLNVVAVSPLVIVSANPVLPMSSSDDVLFHIDGTITATSTRFPAGAIVQIALDDLDGSLNQVGFNLRSIMGRYLWDSANLPEQDYPHVCASQG